MTPTAEHIDTAHKLLGLYLDRLDSPGVPLTSPAWLLERAAEQLELASSPRTSSRQSRSRNSRSARVRNRKA